MAVVTVSIGFMFLVFLLRLKQIPQQDPQINQDGLFLSTRLLAPSHFFVALKYMKLKRRREIIQELQSQKDKRNVYLCREK